ncbi:hypothetical protein ACFLUG_02575 [Chloroflexota bacterium]
MNQVFSRLNPNHKLFQNLVDKNPIWWQNLVEDQDIYIEVRKGNYLDVYYNGGRILDLSFTDKFKGKIHFEYIPLVSQEEYVPLEINENTIKFRNDSTRILEIKDFSEAELKLIKKRISMFYSPSSEKGIQANFVINNTQFLDTEFQHRNGIRFDLIWADVAMRKLFVVELKTIGDQRLYIGEKSKEIKKNNKIDQQLKNYSTFVGGNQANLLSHYQRVFQVKKNLGILPSGLKELDSLENFTFEEKPILLIGDCTQAWIEQQWTRLNMAIKEIAYGCFYQGKSTRQFSIPEKTKGNKHIFV